MNAAQTAARLCLPASQSALSEEIVVFMGTLFHCIYSLTPQLWLGFHCLTPLMLKKGKLERSFCSSWKPSSGFLFTQSVAFFSPRSVRLKTKTSLLSYRRHLLPSELPKTLLVFITVSVLLSNYTPPFFKKYTCTQFTVYIDQNTVGL